jgi:hypothetical protein
MASQEQNGHVDSIADMALHPRPPKLLEQAQAGLPPGSEIRPSRSWLRNNGALITQLPAWLEIGASGAALAGGAKGPFTIGAPFEFSRRFSLPGKAHRVSLATLPPKMAKPRALGRSGQPECQFAAVRLPVCGNRATISGTGRRGQEISPCRHDSKRRAPEKPIKG